MPLFRVCSKDNTMVKEVFQHLAETYFGQKKQLEDDYAQPITSIFELQKNKPRLGDLRRENINNGRHSITVGQAPNANAILQGTIRLEDAYEKTPA